VFVPPEVGFEIYAGSIIAIIPIIWASFEFYSRIKVQRECLVCNGSGLVYVTKSNTPLTRARKCWSCGNLFITIVIVIVIVIIFTIIIIIIASRRVLAFC
jgi:hypothetical protein